MKNRTLKLFAFIGLNFLCFLCFPCTAGAAQESQKPKFTLQDCLHYALQNSYEMHKASYDVEESKAGYAEARGALLPQVEGSATMTHNLKLASTMMPGDFFGAPGTLIPVEMGTKYNTYAGVDLSQVVFDGGLFAGIKISRNARELSELRKTMTREELIFNIGNAFYDILYSQKLLENNRETLSIMDSIYRKVEIQVAQNITREIDLNRMKVNVSNMRVEIEKAAANVAQQTNYLKVLLGMPIGQDMELEEAELQAVDPALQAGGNSDLPDRIELHVLDKEKHINMLEISRLKQGRIPTVSLVASSGYQFESDRMNLGNRDFWSNGSYVGARVSVPVFNGFRTRSQIRQSQFRLNRLEEEIRQTEQTILGDRQNAGLQLQVSYRAVNVQRENVAVAEKTYQQAIMLYREGLYSITDLLDTEKSFRDAQTAHVYELVNYSKTLLALQRAEGKLNELIK